MSAARALAPPPRRRPAPRERGVALIAALLVVALATVTALAMISEQRIGVARTENLLDAEQAYLYALGAEDWAVEALARTAGSGLATSARTTVIRPALGVPDAKLVATVEDMQARLNLNGLIVDGRPDPVALARFRRLLAALQLDRRLADAVVDWIDADQRPVSGDGAEDDYYLRRTPAHRTADAPLASVSELRLIRGFAPAVIEALAPYVTVLPEPTPVNVNTAPPAVLATLADGIGPEEAARMARDRDVQPFRNLDEFAAYPGLRGHPEATRSVSVDSDYYRLTAEVTWRRGRARLTSLLRRDHDGTVRVLARSQG